MQPRDSSPESDNSDDEQSSDSELEIERDQNWHYVLDHCRATGDLFAFQVVYAEVQRCAIRIYQDRPPYCSSCNGPLCRHIQWLYGELARTRQTGAQGGVYDHIRTLGLDTVCEELNWSLGEEGGSPGLELTSYGIKKPIAKRNPGRSTGRMSLSRKKDVRKMMAALSPVIADQYRADIFEQDIPIQDIFVPRDLEATICKLLLVDDDTFHLFKDIISSDDLALDFLFKTRARIEEIFALHDEFLQHGPASEDTHHDVHWCASNLVGIVEAITAINFSALGFVAKVRAVKLLVMILQQVVSPKRNTDVHANITWTRSKDPEEEPADKNLYKLLIGETLRHNPAKGHFVLEAFDDLKDVASGAVEDLDEILTIISSPGFGSPVLYARKLENLISQLKSNKMSAASIAAKRPGERLGGQSKRMK